MLGCALLILLFLVLFLQFVLWMCLSMLKLNGFVSCVCFHRFI